MAHNTRKTNKTTKTGVRRHRFNPAAVIFFLALIIGAGIVIFLLIDSSKHPVIKTSEDKPSSSQQETNHKDKNEDTKKESEKEEPKREEEKSSVNQYDGENPNSLGEITGIVNYTGVYDGQLQIRVSIDQSVSGTCDFTITSPSGAVITGTSNTNAGPTSTFCSYNVEPPESGTWNISVKVTSPDKTGIITGTGEV